MKHCGESHQGDDIVRMKAKEDKISFVTGIILVNILGDDTNWSSFIVFPVY